ncbi:MAG: hypothetical protein ABH870_07500 [bacterium]
MRLAETQDSRECRSFLAMIGRPSYKEMIISLSESEMSAIKTVIGILERASKLNEDINPDIRAHEDVFFRAETELKEILEDFGR